MVRGNYCFPISILFLPKQIKAHATAKWVKLVTFRTERWLLWLQNLRSSAESVSWMARVRGKVEWMQNWNYRLTSAEIKLSFHCRLLTPCSCRGTQGFVHRRCLERWLSQSGLSHCELCRNQFPTANHLRWLFPTRSSFKLRENGKC